MAGYHGYSMSNNAVDAYESGEKPLSKWSKKDIIDLYKEECENDRVKPHDLSKVKVNILKSYFLEKTSWHHTSSRFNKTDFYSYNHESLTKEEYDDLIKRSNIKKEKEEERIEKWECEYLTWSGTRKHPKATEHREVVNRDFSKNYAMTDYGKKMCNANGFRFIRKVD